MVDGTRWHGDRWQGNRWTDLGGTDIAGTEIAQGIVARIAGPGNARRLPCHKVRFLAHEPHATHCAPCSLQYGRDDQHRAGSGEEETVPDVPGGALTRSVVALRAG